MAAYALVSLHNPVDDASSVAWRHIACKTGRPPQEKVVIFIMSTYTRPGRIKTGSQMKKQFITTAFFLLGLLLKIDAQTTPGPPLRFDFEAPHNNVRHFNPVQVPYSASAPRRFDFEAPHKDTLHRNPPTIPYTPGVPRRFDFEAPHRHIIRKN